MFEKDNTVYKVRVLGTQGVLIQGDTKTVKEKVREYLQYYGITSRKYGLLERLISDGNAALKEMGRPTLNWGPVATEAK